MARVKISRNVLNAAVERSVLSVDEKERLTRMIGDGAKKGSASLDLTDVPTPFVWSLLDDSRLGANQRAAIALQLHGMPNAGVGKQAVYDQHCQDPTDFGSTFLMLGHRAPNCEVFYNNRWYPVIMHVDFVKGQDDLTRSVVLHAHLSICEITYSIRHHIYSELFLDDAGEVCERSVQDVLNRLGLRPLQTSAGDFNLKLVRAERLARDQGKVITVAAAVLEFSDDRWWSQLETRALGTAESPRRAVVEPELEVSENHRSYYSAYGNDDRSVSRLPFVRVFSLDLKRYVFADVDDIAEYEFKKDAMNRLHLPDRLLSVLSKVFGTPLDRLFGDVIAGKHGGVVVLASGSPGVGKTLTAEVYAEQTERPLYVLELGELGTNVEQVEENLGRVFTRVSRWNAVLQFDECEIFLTERGDDLNRSAIVGIFLRLLDYYEGILFLTTNRPEVLDHAVRSRVMLKLEYPDLDLASRRQIWETMFAAAGLSLTDGNFEELAETKINGRQIRNLSRLAKVLHPDGGVTLTEMRYILTFGCA